MLQHTLMYASTLLQVFTLFASVLLFPEKPLDGCALCSVAAARKSVLLNNFAVEVRCFMRFMYTESLGTQGGQNVNN